jgi:hypothetical protein
MDIDKVKRYSLVEATLLAILMIGLLIAQLIVKNRSRVILSEPLFLPGSGLSVSLPENPGWERTPDWNYEKAENSMFLLAQLRIPGNGDMEISWRYFFSTQAGTETDHLQQRARQNGAVIQATDNIGKKHPMPYARMVSESDPYQECFWGILHLDFDRSLEFLVKSRGMDSFYTEDVFQSLASTFQYQLPQWIEDGSALMQAFLESQAQAELPIQLADEAFLIKNTLQKNLGYYYARQHLFADNDQVLRKLQIKRYEHPGFRSESMLLFNPVEANYRWRSDIFRGGRTKPELYDVVFDRNDGLSVSHNQKETLKFSPGHLILPEALMGEYSVAFLESEFDTVLVDVISSTGQLVPVSLEKISPDQAAVRAKEAVSIIRLNYLHRAEFFEELLFDASKALLGRFEQQPDRQGRIWDSVSPEQLQDIFQMDLKFSSDEIACGFTLKSDNQVLTLLK